MAVQKTHRGELDCQLLEFPLDMGVDLTPSGPVPDNTFAIGDHVVSRSTPSLGEGVIVESGPMLAQVRFSEAPGKLAQKPIRCHVSALRKIRSP